LFWPLIAREEREREREKVKENIKNERETKECPWSLRRHQTVPKKKEQGFESFTVSKARIH
jgi:hypothetical protein